MCNLLLAVVSFMINYEKVREDERPKYTVVTINSFIPDRFCRRNKIICSNCDAG